MRAHHPLSRRLLSFVFIWFGYCRVRADCISLEDSTRCPAFQRSSIDTTLPDYAFLSRVTSVQDFDIALQDYVEYDFPALKYHDQYKCPKFQSANTARYYARFTNTILCASIVQKSRDNCSAKNAEIATVCATTCASYAESQVSIISAKQCGLSPDSEIMVQIRQDYNLCTTPSSAYAHLNCVDGQHNEPVRCGFAGNTEQLCALCASLHTNGTEECCHSISPVTCSDRTTYMSSDVPTSSSSLSKHEHSFSGGLIGAIVACVIGIVLAILFLTIIVYWKRNRAASLRHRMCTLNSLEPKTTPDARLQEKTSQVVRTVSSEQINASLLESCSSEMADTYSSSSIDTQHFRDRSAFIPNPVRTISPYTAVRGQQGPRCRRRLSSGIGPLMPTYTDHHTGMILQVGSIVTCAHGYEPVLSDELQIRPGERIQILEIYDDSWCRGFILGSKDTDARAFPLVCVSAGDAVYGSSDHGRGNPVAVLNPQDHRSGSHFGAESRPSFFSRNSASRFTEHVEVRPGAS